MIEQTPCAGLNALDNRVMLAAIFHLKNTQNENSPPIKNPARELVFRTGKQGQIRLAGNDPRF